MNNSTEITEVTRRNLFDEIVVSKIWHSGRLDEPNFLNRIFNLKELPSNDRRFTNAYDDIYKHTVMNSDWDADWFLHDPRINLLWTDDETFLKFICEMVHPVVRSDDEEVIKLVEIFNRHLANDGYEIAESTKISGRSVFIGRKKVLSGAPALKEVQGQIDDKDANYISRQITRMQSSIDTDPDLAIGTAKEMIETYCKTILAERAVSIPKNADLIQLVKITAKELSLSPSDIPETVKASKSIKTVLGNLAAISQGLAELRNVYGTGHGKEASSKGLQPRHAKLAVGAASTLVVFLYETHKIRKK